MNASRPGAGRVIEVLTALALIGGGLLILAEFLTLFEIRSGELAVQEQSGGEHHAFAMLVAGVAVIGGALLSRATETWPPAAAVCVIGLAALALALFGDLPDATREDLVRGARPAKAEPALGFTAEVVGAALAVVAGALLAFRLRPSEAR
jgi:hypothetical protein